MKKEEIIVLLLNNHASFIELISCLSEQDFNKQIAQKWTPGKQAKHIVLSIKPVGLAFGLPLFLLKLLFGKTNRSSKTFEELVQKYHDKIALGGRASKPFVPETLAFKDKQPLLNQLQKSIFTLCKKISFLKEEELDIYVLPHPLLGKVTLREMLYFTAYHVQHHHQSIQQILKP